MKKIVTTLLAFLSAFTLCIGFTACGDKDGKNQTTVTEKQWKDAIDVFSENRTKVNEKNSNVKLKLEMGELGSDSVWVNTYDCDYDSKAIFMTETNDGKLESELYIWYSEEDGKIYNGGYNYDDYNEGVKIYFKNDVTDEFDTQTWDECHLIYASIHYEFDYIFEAMCGDKPLKESYNLFSYDKSTGAYTYSRSFPDASERDYNVNIYMEVYFEDGKLVQTYLEHKYIESAILQCTDTYKITLEYGTAEVTVPQSYSKNLITSGQWDNFFNVNNPAFNNIKITSEGSSTENNQSVASVLEFDNNNKIIYSEEYKGAQLEYYDYYFVQDGKFYSFQSYDQKKVVASSGVTFRNKYEDYLEATVLEWAVIDEGIGFNDFEFDPETGAYFLDKEYEHSEENDATLSISAKYYFEDGKLVRVDYEMKYYYYGVQTDKGTFKFEYGVVDRKVPQNILDMEPAPDSFFG